MRVAVVTESFLPQVNGVTNSVLRVLETLKQREHEAIVIAPTAVSQRHLGFEVFTTPALPVMQFPVALPSLGISRILDDFEPDVIHVAAPFLLGAQALTWANRNGVPTVAIYQTDVAGYLARYNLRFAKPVMEKIVSSIHSQATLNLAPTPQTAKYLQSLGLDNVRVWGRGVDQDLFNPGHRNAPQSIALRRELAPSGGLLVGFVGRLAQEKQVHRMAELLDIPGLSFVVVGDGPERENLEQLLGSRVSFTGALSGLELARAYAALDIFVHFGTEETFGQTIQEAQASALPVVAPASGGPVHLIESGVSGILVDHSPGSYRRAVVDLLNPDFRSEIAAGALKAIAGKSWAANNARLLEQYELAGQLVHQRMARELELA